MKDKALAYLPKYLAILLGIVAAWYVATLGTSAHFVTLIVEANLVKLSLLVVGWLSACFGHVALTGDWAPVAPSGFTAAERVRLRAVLAAHEAGTLRAFFEQHAPSFDPPAATPAPEAVAATVTTTA